MLSGPIEIVTTNYTVADYCNYVKNNDIQVNRQYQRSDKIWPSAARSFLIETLLLGFPVPKLSLYQKVDVRSRKTFKEIVDGQQRTAAIVDFFKDELRLSRRLETSAIAGKRYSELPNDYKERFLNYSLSADIFVGTTPEEIREVFRRINSYTVPLNPEEERHATFQGNFKWFVYRLSKRHDTLLARVGVFGEKQFARMQDAKLFTELGHALVHGITTTDKNKLAALYKSFNESFDHEEDFVQRIEVVFEFLDQWEAVHGGPLMKAYVLYSLILATTHVLNPVDKLQAHYQVDGPAALDNRRAIVRLSELAEVLERPDEHLTEDEDEDEKAPSVFTPFVKACTSKTNVGSQRETRFRWFCKALLNRGWE